MPFLFIWQYQSAKDILHYEIMEFPHFSFLNADGRRCNADIRRFTADNLS
mgnify:CR=1 FL=1